jgi:hypothetical protein
MAPRKIKNKAPLFRKLEPAAASAPISVADTLPKWFPKNPIHRFGTCWKCGLENEIPGGDYFKCSKDGWLPWKSQNIMERSVEPDVLQIEEAEEPLLAIEEAEISTDMKSSEVESLFKEYEEDEDMVF